MHVEKVFQRMLTDAAQESCEMGSNFLWPSLDSLQKASELVHSVIPPTAKNALSCVMKVLIPLF
jgi:hypothetical protein